MAFDGDFVEVAGIGDVEGPKCEAVDNEDVGGGQPADFGIVGCCRGRRRVAG